MMPMIAASTGAAFLPSASPAALPLDHDQHAFADTGADGINRQQRRAPRVPSGVCGCTSSSFAPSSLRCFCVETTVPTTWAICIVRLTRDPSDPRCR